MQPPYAPLFERIRQKCQRQGWYGGDLLSPARRNVPLDDPQRTGFAFPPASEEQLLETEAELGFSLPPLLRALYAQVANGGFGPGTGLRGASGGFGTPFTFNQEEMNETIIGCFECKEQRQQIDLADYEWQTLPAGSVNTDEPLVGWYAYDESNDQLIDLADYEWHTPPSGSVNTNDYPLLRTRDYLLLPYEVWPRHLLRICDMGCVQEVCIDPQEKLFLAAASKYDEKYLLFRLAAPSFEQWLEDWLYVWKECAMAIKKSELYSSLWKSCDELRGGMDASQYKDYVLVLLFVKYVSDKYAGQPDALIVVPPGGSFADMVAARGQKDIGDRINKIKAALAVANNLTGVITVADFNDPDKLGKGKEMQDRLSNLVGIFQNPALDFRRNRAEGDDLLGDAYEYLMRNFATQSGKSKGQFYTPAEVSRVIAKVIGTSKATSSSQSIYDPTCGSGSLLLKANDEAPMRLSIYGQEMDNATAAIPPNASAS